MLLVHLFVYFTHVHCCPFCLLLGVRGWLRLLIVALIFSVIRRSLLAGLYSICELFAEAYISIKSALYENSLSDSLEFTHIKYP